MRRETPSSSADPAASIMQPGALGPFMMVAPALRQAP